MIVQSTQSTTLITTAYRRKYWTFSTMRSNANLPFWPRTKSSCAIKSVLITSRETPKVLLTALNAQCGVQLQKSMFGKQIQHT